MQDREYWRKELQGVSTLYIVGIARSKSRWDYGMWRRFRVFYCKDGELRQVFIEGDDVPSYWVPWHRTKSGRWTGGYFEVKVLGTDRPLEIAYALKRWLGRRDHFKVKFLSWLD